MAGSSSPAGKLGALSLSTEAKLRAEYLARSGCFPSVSARVFRRLTDATVKPNRDTAWSWCSWCSCLDLGASSSFPRKKPRGVPRGGQRFEESTAVSCSIEAKGESRVGHQSYAPLMPQHSLRVTAIYYRPVHSAPTNEIESGYSMLPINRPASVASIARTTRRKSKLGRHAACVCSSTFPPECAQVRTHRGRTH